MISEPEPTLVIPTSSPPSVPTSSVGTTRIVGVVLGDRRCRR